MKGFEGRLLMTIVMKGMELPRMLVLLCGVNPEQLVFLNRKGHVPGCEDGKLFVEDD